MSMTTMRVRITFLESLLGTSPANEDVYKDFIGSKAPDAATIEDEVAALGTDAIVERGTTVFPRTEDGKPFLYDYQVRGFFKDACGMLGLLTGKNEKGKRDKKMATNESGKLGATSYRKIIDGLIFVSPRAITLNFEGDVKLLQRPLRAQTQMGGERTALAISEEIPAGATAEFTVTCLDESHLAAVREWLDYGFLRGIGQWRNSGHGRFSWEELDENGNVIDYSAEKSAS